jgi:small redox-active disulfide protein 2
MRVQVLGGNCARCRRLYAAARRAVDEAGVAATVEKVTDVARMLEFAPPALPALAIDGRVAAGHVPSADEIKAFFPGRSVS